MSVRADSGPRPVSRPRARRWLIGAANVAAIAAVAFWVHLYEFNGEVQYDAALFLTIGKLLQRGLLLYRDLWDTKPPGIYVYQSAVFAVLPVAVWSLRLTDYLLYVAAGVLFFRLCAIEARWPLAFFATAVWLYWAHHPAFNMAGFYTEEYSAMGAIAAVAAAARYWRGGGLAWVAVSGAAAAAAVLFKHPGAACGIPVVVLISGRRPARALALFAVCGALPLLAVIGYFWWHGALDAFLDCQFFSLLTQHDDAQHQPGERECARLARLRLQQRAGSDDAEQNGGRKELDEVVLEVEALRVEHDHVGDQPEEHRQAPAARPQQHDDAAHRRRRQVEHLSVELLDGVLREGAQAIAERECGRAGDVVLREQ